eukprot:TRINITY_DN12326_c0_g1_i1.p1 TRINITY_DN12326_c0_g1~~TRINITY_DN12326_c0_g1_i1.p1  ORF type:complete len:119 (-),score=13.26 TRINITY_DN12326_c0_g1_i1:3-359(-)
MCIISKSKSLDRSAGGRVPGPESSCRLEQQVSMCRIWEALNGDLLFYKPKISADALEIRYSLSSRAMLKEQPEQRSVKAVPRASESKTIETDSSHSSQARLPELVSFSAADVTPSAVG